MSGSPITAAKFPRAQAVSSFGRQSFILLVGFLLLGIQGVSEIIKKIAVMRGDMDDPNPPMSLEEIAEQEVAMAEARND